ILTGKYSMDKLPSGLRGLAFRQILPGVEGLLSCLQAIAQERQKTPAQVAINWCMCKGTIPIPGAKTLHQAEQNIGALGWQLSDGEVNELDHAASRTDKKMVQNIFQTR
ncbi:MAG: aldo/keto reductase, partial [Elainellaceae cyanobacterium]